MPEVGPPASGATATGAPHPTMAGPEPSADRENVGVADSVELDQVPLVRWRDELVGLTATRESAHQFRISRYLFAHAVAEQLTADGRSDGHVLYGVQMAWGPLYIGQTKDGRRRLRDLVIGESHHLANTFPPEIWQTIIVIGWPRLKVAEPVAIQHGRDATGLALEHALQERLNPLFNGQKRTRIGGWRVTDYARSRSQAAILAHTPPMACLADEVVALWNSAANGQRATGSDDSVCYALQLGN